MELLELRIRSGKVPADKSEQRILSLVETPYLGSVHYGSSTNQRFLAVKLLLKWPNLYYSTSAFAPKYWPEAIIKFANSRGSDKVIYAGYFPMGLELTRIFDEMDRVPFKDHVWPKFLYDNAAKLLKLPPRD